MATPNEFSQADILAAREIVKARNHPAHACDIDAGKWDNYGEMERAKAELIRARDGEAIEE